MADRFDKKTRSRVMQAVRVAGTEPEERLDIGLRAMRLRFRRNDARVFGKPDFSFPNARLAVFVDGDFWHGREWFESHVAPATNVEFWVGKFERNRRRDRLVDNTLRKSGWSVLRLWGSDVRKAPVESARRVWARLRRLERAGRPFPLAQSPVARSARKGNHGSRRDC